MSRCAYLNCHNTRKDNISMFAFPVQDKHRLRLWISHSGNTNLTSLTDNELQHRFICAAHFHPACMHQGEKKCRLLGPAVPKHYQLSELDEPQSHLETRILLSPNVLKVKTPTKFYTRRYRNVEQADDEHSSSTSSSLFGGPFQAPSLSSKQISRKLVFEEPQEVCLRKQQFELEKSQKKQKILLKKVKAVQLKLYRLQKTKSMLHSCCINIDKHNFRSQVSKTLTLMQLKKKKITRWTQEEKNFCLSLFYKPPAGYKLLCRQGVVLAAPSTIRSWLSSCLPGLSEDVFSKIQKRFENASITEKSCVICFDEMAVMSTLNYSKKFDFIEGFEDLGGNRRSNKIAKNALVFLARGLFSKWKFPVAYFLSSSNVKANDLELLVKAVLNKLFDCGLLPKAVVCDQMSTNQKIYKKMGVSVNSPFFFCNGRKLFALYDMPHLIKSVRNHFLQNNFIIGHQEVSFQDIVKTYEIDKVATKSRCLLKITLRHLNPNAFQKMTVSLATQIFCHSVSAAVRTAKDTKQLTSETAYNTSKFIEVINNMFDGMNSRTKFEKNVYRCALTKNMTFVRKSLLKGKQTFQEINKISIKKYKNEVFKKVLTRPPCFDGIVQTIEATLQLFDEESTESKVNFLITNKLNQDVIENLFALFRQKGGSNRNPSACVLRGIFRSNLVNSLIKLPKTRNCEEDSSKFITNLYSQPQVQQVLISSSPEESNEDIYKNPVASTSFSQDKHDLSKSDPNAVKVTSQQVNITLEDCAVQYLAGYVAKICIDKFKCITCQEKLIKEFDLNDEGQLLILNKTFGFMNTIKLKTPSDLLLRLTDLVLIELNKSIEQFYVKKLKTKIFKSVISFLSCEAEELLGFTCQEHIYFIINHLLIVKICFYCKNKKNSFTKQLKPQPKLRIIKNQ